MVQWQYLFLQPTSLQTRYGGCSWVIWLWLIRKITLDNSTSMKNHSGTESLRAIALKLPMYCMHFWAHLAQLSRGMWWLEISRQQNVVARCPHLPLAIRQELSHFRKELSCEDANFEVLRILLVSLCQLNVYCTYIDWAVAVPAFTSWLVVKTSLRLRARGLPFSATKEQAGKSSSDLLGCLVWSFLGSFDSISL